ncbi:MAG: hypothetical protein ACO3X1_14560, partial [Burkholderiaceae bacterium]
MRSSVCPALTTAAIVHGLSTDHDRRRGQRCTVLTHPVSLIHRGISVQIYRAISLLRVQAAANKTCKYGQGQARLLAARKLGLAEVPVVSLDHLSDTQRRALILADNKIAENATWDEAVLGVELAALSEAGFELGLTGFSQDEWERLIEGDLSDEKGLTDEDAVPEVSEHAVTKPGDIWILGDHKLLCGD